MNRDQLIQIGMAHLAAAVKEAAENHKPAPKMTLDRVQTWMGLYGWLQDNLVREEHTKGFGWNPLYYLGDLKIEVESKEDLRWNEIEGKMARVQTEAVLSLRGGTERRCTVPEVVNLIREYVRENNLQME